MIGIKHEISKVAHLIGCAKESTCDLRIRMYTDINLKPNSEYDRLVKFTHNIRLKTEDIDFLMDGAAVGFLKK